MEDLEAADTEVTYHSLEDFYLYARDDAYIYGGIEHGMIIAGHTPTTAEQEFPFNDGNALGLQMSHKLFTNRKIFIRIYAMLFPDDIKIMLHFEIIQNDLL